MAILNVTPDSFYAASRAEPAPARLAVDALVAEGPEMIDLGAESSRPGSVSVPPEEQIERLGPALERALSYPDLLVSVDTRAPEVAEYALKKGAHAINDVSCLRERSLARVVARFDAVLILMHSRTPMQQMAGFSEYPDSGYSDVALEVAREWSDARERALAAGVPQDRIWFDPGLGFNKNARQSFELLRRLREFAALEARILLGPSRKSFIAAVDATPPEARLAGTIAACLSGRARGADMLRVHDVGAIHQALVVQRAIDEGQGPRD